MPQNFRLFQICLVSPLACNTYKAVGGYYLDRSSVFTAPHPHHSVSHCCLSCGCSAKCESIKCQLTGKNLISCLIKKRKEKKKKRESILSCSIQYSAILFFLKSQKVTDQKRENVLMHQIFWRKQYSWLRQLQSALKNISLQISEQVVS